MFEARDQSAKLEQPSEEPFDMPAATVSTQLPAVLGLRAVALVRCDQFDAADAKLEVERVAIVCLVADEPLRHRSYEARPERLEDELRFMALTTSIPMAIGRPWRSATATILVALPRRVRPTSRPPFCPRVGAIDIRLGQIDLADIAQVLGQCPQYLLEHTKLDPALEPPMARLVRRVSSAWFGPAGASSPTSCSAETAILE